MARQPISAVLAHRARVGPADVLVTDRNGDVTAGEINTRATRLARLLIDRGVRRDDLVAVSLPNDVGFVVACMAVWRVGATPMPLPPGLSDEDRAALEEVARPAAAFGSPPFRADIAWVDEAQAAGFSDAQLADRWAHCWKAPTSSGSTGRPKVIASTAPALVDPEAPIAPFVPHRAIQLVSSPLWHATAFTYAFRGLTAGHRLVIEPEFDERSFLAAVDRHQISWAVVSPPSIRRLLRLARDVRDRHDLSSLESILHLGGRCPVPDKLALIDWLGADRVVEVYAGTESNGLTMVGGAEWLAHPGSVGKPIGGTHTRITRADGTLAAPGETGEIWMRRGLGTAYRYLGVGSRRTTDGWDTLGDIGYLDTDGYLYVIDRAADVVHRDGTTLYPADIEQVFERHPMVRGAVAVGDDAAGARLTVVADVADNALTTDALAAFAAAHLPRSHRPDRICLAHRPLRNDAGKIRRRSLTGCSPELATLHVNGVPA
ncbi:AMP-binding protein [Gordonia sp. NPDC062954]|uniref:AMP-binding protein n=1 Tax=Gordonia aquimaris TaxID=2984863 RepID=A0A9X3D540_9ACTN|nr:AMP-binding protein [Gordonia aquimaris]MCX2964892.1 AMP-binding protein [Gordonia aquimaris]